MVLAGAALAADAQSTRFKLGKWTEIQTAILQELTRSYVDSLPIDRIERRGIDAMLETSTLIRSISPRRRTKTSRC